MNTIDPATVAIAALIDKSRAERSAERWQLLCLVLAIGLVAALLVLWWLTRLPLPNCLPTQAHAA